MPSMDSEKYSLRQRQKRKRSLVNSSLDSQGYASDNSTESLSDTKDCPQRSKTSKSLNVNGGGVGKSKSKAAPLSKYRRKTANARERTRMREINSAFETLRTCVPPCITNEDAGCTNEKLTKITTLRLAMKYIRILTEALANPNEADYNFLYDCTKPKPIQHKTEENLEPLIEKSQEKAKKASKTTKNPKVNTKSSANSRKTSTSKRVTKKQKVNNVENICHQTSPIPALCQESPVSNSSSAYASLSSASDSSASPVSNSSYIFDNCIASQNFTYNHPHHHNNSMSDLSNLMLESDGESLNVPERCLSPLQTSNKKSSSLNNDNFECSPIDMQTLENPLELSLRLMEPASDSLGLTVDPIILPPSCLSPLINLEPFSTFDLFHTDFNEQAALDLFLT